ncbi:hydrolase [Zeaxanthinibacter sp. PT1]|uniref:hydrolase n=1 Tax=Zeaxanthinibacter TaxID=561554 RepID=UPI002349DBB2|nr:hydrolase [Zeaxanthinibacter sp. PT1]MDC6351634.1 hydrolase [Zeaxanthinibacter sp. PT1]
MKQRIFLYLFIFASLIALYFYASGSNQLGSVRERVDFLEEETESLKDSLKSTKLQVLDMQYFSLENNDDALAYYDDLDLDNPSRYIADKLLETNEQKGDNPLIPYEGMESDFKINKIKILNHKWIIADFSDGKFWGEILIRYELKDDMGVDFTLIDHLLYSQSGY